MFVKLNDGSNAHMKKKSNLIELDSLNYDDSSEQKYGCQIQSIESTDPVTSLKRKGILSLSIYLRDHGHRWNGVPQVIFHTPDQRNCRNFTKK